jgi:periplasmic protein TonB
MFESATLTAAPASTRLWSTCAGISGQALIVGCMLLAPLIWPAVLPNLRESIMLVAPGPPPAPPPPPGEFTVRPKAQVTRVFNCTVCAPAAVPKTIAVVNDIDDPPPAVSSDGVRGGVIGGSKDGVIGGVLTGIINSVKAPPQRIVETAPEPVKTAVVAPPKRYTAGGLVKLAAPTFHPDPIYPDMAIRGRVEGVVQLEGIIGIDGRIHSLKVLHGHPFLVNAAVAAVKQWVYTPATLNGDLVEVIAPITVTFRLGGR